MKKSAKPAGKSASKTQSHEGASLGVTKDSVPEFGSWEARALQPLLEIIPDVNFVNIPFYNLDRIDEEAVKNALQAAVIIGNVCRVSENGHQLRRRYEIAAAYTAAWYLRGKKEQIQILADNVSDGRSKTGLDPTKVAQNLLHYTFIFIFHVIAHQTRNRATQYALAMQKCFDDGVEPSKAKLSILLDGPEKLYRNYIENQHIVKAIEKITAEESGPARIDDKIEKIDGDVISVEDETAIPSQSPFNMRIPGTSEPKSMRKQFASRGYTPEDTKSKYEQTSNHRMTLSSKEELQMMVKHFAERASKNKETENERKRIAKSVQLICFMISEM